MMRLFVALDTPVEIKRALTGVRDRLASSDADVRWEPPEKMHATLKFLGQTDEALLPRISAALERIGADTAPLHTRYQTLGCFPGRSSPRVVWAGMEDAAGGLAMLAARVDTAMVPLGFERDTRPFHPHVTLGRVRGSRNLDRLRSLMESITFDGPPVTLHELCLMKSVIRPDGSVYSTLQIVPLVGNRADTK